MNKIKGVVKEIRSAQGISLIKVETPIGPVNSVIVGEDGLHQYMAEGKNVYVLFKETEVSIGKKLEGKISLRNRFDCILEEIQKGDILSRLILNCRGHRVVSIITTGSVIDMELKEGDLITAMVKTNEVSLMEILDGD